jgi:hypothetical protein
MRIARWLGRSHRRARASGGPVTWVVPKATALFFALVFVVFTCVEPYLAAINNPNENVRTYMTMAIVENHTFQLDDIVMRHAWINDMARVPETAGKLKPGEPVPIGTKSHLLSVKGPATSYFGVPFYWAFTKIAPRLGHPVPTLKSSAADRAWWLRSATFAMRLFTVQIPCFLFLVWFERWLRRSTNDVVLRLSAVAAVGLGTNYLAYGLMYVSHATSAVAAFLAFGITMGARLDSLGDARARSVRAAFLAGLFAGMVPALEYTAVQIGLILAIYGLTTFWRPKQLLAFAVGGAIDVAGVTFYQARACGTWKEGCFKYTENFAWLHTKYLGAGKPDLKFLKDVSLSHSFGFFGMSPYMWLGLVAIPFALVRTYGTPFERRERRVATAVWMVSMAALWVSISAVSNPHGGWSVGPRYFGAAPPFFAFGAVLATERIAGGSRMARTLIRGIAAGLALASAAEIGLISLLFNTVPENAARPLADVAIPLARAGFVPYHAGQLFGWISPTTWYVVAGCLVLAALLAATLPAGDSAWSWTVRIACTILVFTFAILPAFSKPGPLEPFDPNAGIGYSTVWEPPGRDRVHKLHLQAEKEGAVHPCLWWKVVDLEHSVAMHAEAGRDQKRVTVPHSQCN